MNYKNMLIFAAGGAIGAFTGIMATKAHYEAIANKEIEDARAHYNKKLSDMSQKNREKADISDLAASVQANAPRDYSKYDTTTKEDPEVIIKNEEVGDGPILVDITQDDFVQYDGYQKATVVLYRDGVVAKEDDDNLIDVEETIGTDILDRIEGRTKDALYVRNQTLIMDFEVTYSDQTYTEATGIYLRE